MTNDKLVLHCSAIFSSKIFVFMSWVASIAKLHQKLNYFDENVLLLRYCTYSIKIGTLPLSKKGQDCCRSVLIKELLREQRLKELMIDC